MSQNDRELAHQYRKLVETQRAVLDAYKQCPQFLDNVEKYDVVIVAAETGVGKTTELVSSLVERFTYFEDMGKQVLCTQPRRIAAINAAERVAAMRMEEVG